MQLPAPSTVRGKPMLSPDERAEVEQLLGCVIDTSERLSAGPEKWSHHWNRVDVMFELARQREDARRLLRSILDRHTQWVVPS